MHTTASDGQYAPSDIVTLARQRGLDVIAITDHDTTEGYQEARRAVSLNGGPLEILPGIELSAEDESGDVHMLGYLFDADAPHFQQQLEQFRQDRFYRAEKIVRRLDALGLPVAWPRVVEIAGGGAIGRPHIARALVEAGYVNSIAEAFERYIHNGGPAYVARRRMSPEEAIALIHRAGGVAVMAHPALVPGYLTLLKERLIPAGLDGVEVVHPKNPEAVRLDLRGAARQYDLVMTGGSDFHRPEEDGTLLLGTLTPPEGCVQRLRERARRYERP